MYNTYIQFKFQYLVALIKTSWRKNINPHLALKPTMWFMTGSYKHNEICVLKWIDCVFFPEHMINTPSLSVQSRLLHSTTPTPSTRRSALVRNWFIYFLCDQRVMAYRSQTVPNLGLFSSDILLHFLPLVYDIDPLHKATFTHNKHVIRFDWCLDLFKNKHLNAFCDLLPLK